METIASRMTRTMPELGRRELNAMHAENHWRECPARWRAESRRAMARTIANRIEDAGLPESVR